MTTITYQAGSVAKPQKAMKRTASQFAAALDSAVVPVTLGICVGTGGSLTHEYIKWVEQSHRVTAPPSTPFAASRSNASNRGTELSAPELITSLKDEFALGVSDIARLLCVSRQAVYNWNDGDTISADHANTLTKVVSNLKSIKDDGLEIMGSTFRRKLVNGFTFAEMIGQGVTVEVAANTLHELLRAEADERARLSERLAMKGNITRSAESEFMPTFDERT